LHHIEINREYQNKAKQALEGIYNEVNREYRNEAKQALEGIYNASTTVWPLHLCLRAVPLLKDVMNSHVKEGIKRLIDRQASFNDEDLGKKKINTWEIKALDFKASASGKMLRDMIMKIRQQDEPTLPLFHSVDHLRSNRATVVFTCMPVVESEARSIVSSLATYLKHRHGDEVIEFFTKDAQVRARESFWDEEHQCVRNEDDAHVESLLNDIDADYVLQPVSKKKQTASPPAHPVPPSLQCNIFGEEDNDSVGTFRHQQQACASAMVTSDDSDSTLVSLTSRLSILESLLKSNNIAIPTDSPPSPPHSQAYSP
jgi:hypothetical protein